MLYSIHQCPCLKLWIVVDCHIRAPKLLNNVVVRLLTLSSVLPWVLLVIHVPYGLSLAILSFINMSSYCWTPCHAICCFVVSGTSSPTCLLIVVPAMSESVISFAMFACILPSFLLIFGISSVRELCSLSLVLACHHFFAMITSFSMLFHSSKHCNLMLFLASL